MEINKSSWHNIHTIYSYKPSFVFLRLFVKVPLHCNAKWCYTYMLRSHDDVVFIQAHNSVRPNNATYVPWWRHQMETFSALLALCAGNTPVPANSPHKGQWRGALMFSLIYAWINDWVNSREAGDSRRQRGHYYINVMIMKSGNGFSPVRCQVIISTNDGLLLIEPRTCCAI